jgi:hypothetical protein
MPAKKPRSAAQLANDQRLRDAAKARKAVDETDEEAVFDATDFKEVSELDELKKQMQEIKESNALLRAALLGNQSNSTNQSVGVGRGGQLLGEVDKYLVDPDNYPDPTKRLAAEPRLQSIAFGFNYELEYQFSILPYETKTGINMREPQFLVTLLRKDLDDQGEQKKVVGKDGQLLDKYYIARRMVFHEDPQAALVIARENQLEVDRTDEKAFLNEMRYIRVRDWLFDFLWPKPAQTQEGVREEAVGGTIVQVYTKSSVEPSSVDFDQLTTKV